MTEDYVKEAKRKLAKEADDTISYLRFVADEYDLQWEWVLEEFRSQLARKITKVIA